MSGDGIAEAFARQRKAYQCSGPPDAAARRSALVTLGRLVSENVDQIAAAISEDFGGRAHAETGLFEIVPVLRGIRHARKSVAGWMKPERRRVDVVFQPARAWIRPEPLGVMGIISPWNYPLLLALSPLTDALAAGNRAMLKPSELTPAFARLLARLTADRFDPAQVAVVPGDVEVARAFAALPFDHLLFTGSTAVGRQVMRAAAENLTPVTLELGGKSPAVVLPDYPLAKAARSVSFGKFINAGQTCIAPDYALVPADSAEAFAHAVIAEAQHTYPGISENADYSAIISARHRERLLAAVEQARAGGATVLIHGDPGAGSDKVAPTVVLNPPEACTLMTEEIFGPVLPVVGYHSVEDALAFIAARDRPLALYCFSDDRRGREQVLAGATSGGVTLNGTLLHIAQETLPFGGVGPSGTGSYHGHDGFKRFSHLRAVHQVGKLNVFERLGPPWGQLASMTTRLLARY